MTEPKIDVEKYRGMSAQEAERAMEADRIRALNEDPGLQQIRRDMEEREQAARDEERRQENEARRQRELDSRAMWAEEYDRRLMTWVSHGGAESDFDEVWPDLKRQMLLERVSGDEERKRREAFKNFKL